MAEQLRVDHIQLRVTAETLRSHAEAFSDNHERAQSRAGQVGLGAGKAASALPATLTEWQTTGSRFTAHHVKHADGHRAAAEAYAQIDEGTADEIKAAGRDL